MILTADIGNTNITLGFFENDVFLVKNYQGGNYPKNNAH